MNPSRAFALLFALAGSIAGCKAEPTTPTPAPDARRQPGGASAALPGTPGPSAADLSDEAKMGHQLYAVCHSCHDQGLWPAKGPPMFGVQRRYKRATDSKEAFISRMVTFVTTPSEQTAVMTPAVEQLGLMPALPLGEVPLRQIAAYIYEAEFPPPCEHWKNAIARDQAAGDDHARQDRRMYDKLCK